MLLTCFKSVLKLSDDGIVNMHLRRPLSARCSHVSTVTILKTRHVARSCT